MERSAVDQPETATRNFCDLYLSAALMAKGFCLVRAHRIGGRVTFEFEGQDLDAAVLAWTNRRLEANLADFTHALDRLRTLTYQGV